MVSNAGPATATGATLTDTFPAALQNVSFTSTAAGGATGNTASGTVTGSLTETLTLPANSSVTYTVTATVAANATGNLTNTATVTAPNTAVDSDPDNNEAIDVNTLGAQVDLSVTKTDGVTAHNQVKR